MTKEQGSSNDPKVKDFMTRSLVTVDVTASMENACQVMLEQDVSSVVVMKSNQPAGIVTETDIVTQIAGAKSPSTCVADFMSKPLVTVPSSTRLQEAFTTMGSRRIRRLGLTERKRIVGLVTQTDLINASRRALITARQQQNSLKSASEHDGLTGIYNGTYFHKVLQEQVKRGNSRNSNLAVILLDVDQFKSINDTYGHPAGDKVLASLARILRQSIRPCDVAARVGGDEFAVIAPDVSEQEAVSLAEHIREKVGRSSPTVDGRRIRFSCSLGVATRNGSVNSPSKLVSSADKALYRAKRKSRNCTCT